MKARFTPEAGEQLTYILEWLKERSPQVSASVARRIETIVSLLQDSPHLGQRLSASTVRSVPLGHYPYQIYYVVEADEILVLSVRHTSRRPPKASDLR